MSSKCVWKLVRVLDQKYSLLTGTAIEPQLALGLSETPFPNESALSILFIQASALLSFWTSGPGPIINFLLSFLTSSAILIFSQLFFYSANLFVPPNFAYDLYLTSPTKSGSFYSCWIYLLCLIFQIPSANSWPNLLSQNVDLLSCWKPSFLIHTFSCIECDKSFQIISIFAGENYSKYNFPRHSKQQYR